MTSNLPGYVQKYFWGDDLSQLNWPEHKEYITATLLEKGDVKAVKWLFKKQNKIELKEKLDNYDLSPKSKNFWNKYFK